MTKRAAEKALLAKLNEEFRAFDELRSAIFRVYAEGVRRGDTTGTEGRVWLVPGVTRVEDLIAIDYQPAIPGGVSRFMPAGSRQGGREVAWSLRIATITGTQVRIHITFSLLLVWIWLMHYQIGGTEAAWTGVLFILAVFLCVLLHEFGHIFAARYFGIRTPDVTLLPIGGVARLERMPDKPGQELVIAVAGPLVNVVIAAVLIAYLSGSVGIENLEQIEDPRAGFLARLAAVNIFLVAFNMIPAFPMDGGRVLRGLLAFFMPWARATQIAASIGQGLAFVFGFIGLFYNPMLIFIAIFVYLAATAEAHDAQLRDASSSLLVGDVMVTQFARLPETATVADAVELLLATTQHEFPVVDFSGQLKGLLMQNEIILALRNEGRDARVSEVMRTDVPTIHYRKSLEEALRLMQAGQAPAVAVVDTAGRLIGLITPENIGEMMMVRAARPEALLRKRRAVQGGA